MESEVYVSRLLHYFLKECYTCTRRCRLICWPDKIHLLAWCTLGESAQPDITCPAWRSRNGADNSSLGALIHIGTAAASGSTSSPKKTHKSSGDETRGRIHKVLFLWSNHSDPTITTPRNNISRIQKNVNSGTWNPEHGFENTVAWAWTPDYIFWKSWIPEPHIPEHGLRKTDSKHVFRNTDFVTGIPEYRFRISQIMEYGSWNTAPYIHPNRAPWMLAGLNLPHPPSLHPTDPRLGIPSLPELWSFGIRGSGIQTSVIQDIWNSGLLESGTCGIRNMETDFLESRTSGIQASGLHGLLESGLSQLQHLETRDWQSRIDVSWTTHPTPCSKQPEG